MNATRQKVLAEGKVIGYQFNRDSMGERIFTRTVSTIITVQAEQYGECQIMNITCRVVRRLGGHLWRVIEIDGPNFKCTKHSPDPYDGGKCSWCHEKPTKQEPKP